MTLILSTAQSRCRLRVPVRSLEKARELFQQWRRIHALASFEMGEDCGAVIEDGREIAFISYNDKVWTDRNCTVELVYPSDIRIGTIPRGVN